LTLHKRLWVIVHFVDIGGIVDHYWLMFKISFYNIVLDVSNGQINACPCHVMSENLLTRH
jgi:hypothetical protein